MNDDILSNGMKACGVVLGGIQKTPTKAADTLLAMAKCIDALYELAAYQKKYYVEGSKRWVDAYHAIEDMDEIIGRE